MSTVDVPKQTQFPPHKAPESVYPNNFATAGFPSLLKGLSLNGLTSGKELRVTCRGEACEEAADHNADAALRVGPDISLMSNSDFRRNSENSPADLTHRSGDPLQPAMRAFFEPRFRHDFSNVRVHHDASAAEAAGALNARAYTIGRNVVFGSDQYSPESAAGRRLLAHELAHVVQQSTAGLSPDVIYRQPLAPSVSEKDSPALPSDSHSAIELVQAVHRFFEKYATAANLRSKFPQPDVSDGPGIRAQQALAAVNSLEHSLREGKRVDGLSWSYIRGVVDRAKGALVTLVGEEGQKRVSSALELLRLASEKATYRAPVPLVPGWHRLVDRTGAVVGFLWYSAGYVAVHDAAGQKVDSMEAPLETPVIDPIDIGMLAAGIVAGPVRALLSRAASRIANRTVMGGAAILIGLAEAAPVVTLKAAPIAFVETRVVEASVVKASTQKAVAAFEAKLASAPMTQATKGSATTGVAATRSALSADIIQPSATGAAATAAHNLGSAPAGSVETKMSDLDYRKAIGMVTPADYFNTSLAAVDDIAVQAARVAVADARFVTACKNGQWSLAGTLFHSAAANVASQYRLPPGYKLHAEETIQAGAGGSRLDIRIEAPGGGNIEVDWKTNGKSGLRSVPQMTKHAAQVAANTGTPLTVQVSRSWTDYVRPLLPGVAWLN